MFDFLKRKTKKVSIQTKEKEKGGNYNVQIAAGYAAANSAQSSAEQMAEKYAKPNEYAGNRKLYDDPNAKINAKSNAFANGESVYDPYTGDELLMKKSDAKGLYGEDWQRHLSESDHVKPLKKIFDENQNNPFLTNDDIKSAANSDDNMRVTSRKFNNAKRSRTNEEYVNDDAYLESKDVRLTDEGRITAILDGKNAEHSIDKQLGRATTSNVIRSGADAAKLGAVNAGVTAATMSGVMNIVSVFKGEKDVEDAIADTAADAGKAVVVGGAMSGSLSLVSNTLSNSSSKFIQALTKSNVPGKVITAVMTFGNTLKRYSNGEISTQECIIEAGEKGLTLATAGYSMAVGQALIPIPIVGGAIGALIGTVLTSNCYNQLINDLKVKQFEHEERLRIMEECDSAKAQYKIFNDEMESYLKNYFKDFRDCFDDALSQIDTAFILGDANGVIAGANKITKKLGGTVHYENMDEFMDFLLDDKPVTF